MNLQLILTLAEQQKQAAPTDAQRRRIDKAVAIIEAGGYDRIDEDHLYIRSSSGDTWYHVNGRCECEDFNPWCKHRLAADLLKRADKLAGKVCPVCLEALDCCDYYIGGRGYVSYIFCPTMNNDHYSAELWDHQQEYTAVHLEQAA